MSGVAPLLGWSDSLALGQPVMDETHREFVALLNRFAAADEGDRLASLDEFIAYTAAHIGAEEAWMERTGFPPLACHRAEHAGVLEIMREVRRRVAGGEPQFGQVLAQAVAEWFPLHARSMDAALAEFMRAAGFEPEAACPPAATEERT